MGKVLTDISVRNLKPGTARREIPDAGARGLYVVVQKSGLKSFAVRYRFAGRPRKLTLKAGISLAAARREAADALYAVEKGNDPAVAKRQAKQAQRDAAENTFKAVAEEYLKREGGRLRSADWRRKVLDRLVYKTLGDLPIGEIRRSDVIRLLDKIEGGELKDKDGDPIKGGAVMADRTLAVIRKIMNWHATRSDDFRTPIVRGMARVKAKERARERTLTDDELRAVWKAAEATKGPYGRFVQFLLLTAARRNEGAEMKQAEITGTDWTLPAERNKTKVDLVRPLSAAAQDVLSKVSKLADCEFVFSTDGKHPISGFSRFKKSFDEACGVTGWTLHDLRRTARSLMSRAGVNSDHAERCLGHVISGVRSTYDRHEYYAEKKTAYEALATQIDHIVDPKENRRPPYCCARLDMSRKRSNRKSATANRSSYKILRNHVKSLADFADAAAKDSLVTQEERERLLLERDSLNSSVEYLIEILVAHDALQIGGVWEKPYDPSGWAHLSGALAAAFSIGGRSVENPIIARLQREARKAATVRATNQRILNTTLFRKVIALAAAPLLAKFPRRSINWIAGEILDSVNKDLRAMGQKPKKIDAVRKQIKIRTNARSST